MSNHDELFAMNIQPSDIVVALSGGVDSSVAAALLKMRGWNVHGLFLILPATGSTGGKRLKAVEAVTYHLKIPLEIIDLKEEFIASVIEPFISAYSKGFTPNPCVICNEEIKFRHLRLYAKQKGIPFLATGHYVKAVKRQGITDLWRGKDSGKDQSYFLHRLNQDSLSMAVFPLGEINKRYVQNIAIELDLPCRETSESQELCFLSDGNYREFLENRFGSSIDMNGDIIDSHGKRLGEHKGIHRYTIGQRHGLGIASSRPYYVKEIRPDTREVVVGRKEELFSKNVDAELFNWIGPLPSSNEPDLKAQIRYRHKAASGRLTVTGSNRVRFRFEEPQMAITPGQALVCYTGDRLIGGGWIIKKEADR
ncbi:MAG TPA: tRNA 2-thiouridine(34) synthase MnmA [Desulfobacteraceae bacterium]|nr:tRNA 2-thiouridine(34) synthase MnmA [Desulfobacteraceae bacterium]